MNQRQSFLLLFWYSPRTSTPHPNSSNVPWGKTNLVFGASTVFANVSFPQQSLLGTHLMLSLLLSISKGLKARKHSAYWLFPLKILIHLLLIISIAP